MDDLSGSSPRTGYRKDIEGLRAVAVLPVVAYHVSASIAPGGFIGVDVFFVISGYLITQLLCADIEANRFSIFRFYERRIRRIFPALMVTLAVTFVLGVRYCLPDELTTLSKSTMAAALSASNIYFWQTSGYFNGDELSKPLLHTWSLAVEEQFYLVWPLFLFSGRRYFARWLVPATLLITAVSFTIAAIGAFRFQNATFFCPFTRLWELAIGGLLAMGAVPNVDRALLRNILAALGCALIVGSVFLVRASMPFPGLLALPPVAGAALVIFAGRGGESLVGRALSLKPIAFLGAISYSLYLWHWPINTFQRNYAFMGGFNSATGKVVIVGASLIVATLSWRFIEQPFRTGRRRPSSRRLLQWASAATACVIGAAAIATEDDGLPARFSQLELDTVAHLNRVTHASWRAHRCFLYDGHTDVKLAPECLTVATAEKNYMLLGDSHAAELWIGFHRVFSHVNWLQASASGCLPTVTHQSAEDIICETVIDDVMQHFLIQQHIDNVILVAQWKPNSLTNLATTLDWMNQNHIHVTLLGPTALYDANVPRLVIAAMRASDPSLLQRHMDTSMSLLDTEMRKLAHNHHVDYISLLDLECTRAPCGIDGPWPEISDKEHFNELGSTIIAEKVRSTHAEFGH